MFDQLDDHDKLYLAALVAIEKQDFERAILLLSTYLEANPQDIESLLVLAECYEKVDDPINALITLKAAQKLDPRNGRILAYLGTIYSHFFLHELAINVINQVAELGQMEEYLYSTLAYSYFHLNKMDEAVKICKKGLFINPSWDGLRFMLGSYYLYLKNTEEAINIADELRAKNDPRSDQLVRTIKEDSEEKDKIVVLESKHQASEHFQKAEQLIMKGKFKEGLKELISALQSDNQFAVAYTFLGKILDDYGLIDEGLSLHRRAIEIDPAFAMAYNNLGYTLNVKGEYERAIDSYEKALELDPLLVQAHNSVGTLYDHLGDYEKGISHFKQALQIDPNRFLTLCNLGYAYRALGRVEEALSLYKKAAELYPIERQPRMEIGNIYLEMERYLDAEKEFRAVLENNPEFLMAWLCLACCYLKTGEEAKLHNAIHKAHELPPRDPQEIFMIAEVMERVDKEQAIHYWREYLSISERHPLEPNDIEYAKRHLAALVGTTN